MSTTTIEWAGRNWNMTDGCNPVSPGCLNCYAAAQASREMSPTHVGLTRRARRRNREGRLVSLPVFNGTTAMRPERILEPLSVRSPDRFFVCSMSDLFHESFPFEFIAAVYGVMLACSEHTFLVLTKRPARAREFYEWLESHDGWLGVLHKHASELILEQHAAGNLTERQVARWELAAEEMIATRWQVSAEHPPENIHFGTSTEDQPRFDERLPEIIQIPASVLWLSVEPMIGPIDMRKAPDYRAFLDWIVVGLESGPGARSGRVEWIRQILVDAKDRSWSSPEGTVHDPIPVFVKQLGHRSDCTSVTASKGNKMHEWPSDIRVRQIPAEQVG